MKYYSVRFLSFLNFSHDKSKNVFLAVKLPSEKAAGDKKNMELLRHRNATSLKERSDKSKTQVLRFVILFY